MLQKAELQSEIEVALGATKSTDLLVNAKREHGLQFLIDARRDQSLADVTAPAFRDSLIPYASTALGQKLTMATG